MKRVLTIIAVMCALLLSGCGPLFSLACDRVESRCDGADIAVCDAMMQIAPPHVRSEIVDCTGQAKTCEETLACFSTRGYQVPVTPPAP